MARRKFTVIATGFILVVFWICLWIFYGEALSKEIISRIIITFFSGIVAILSLLIIIAALLEEHKFRTNVRKVIKKRESFFNWFRFTFLGYVLILLLSFIVIIISFSSLFREVSEINLGDIVHYLSSLIFVILLVSIAKQYYSAQTRKSQIFVLRTSIREIFSKELSRETPIQLITHYMNALINALSVGTIKNIPRILNPKLGPKIAYVVLPNENTGQFKVVNNSDIDMEIYGKAILRSKPSLYFRKEFKKLMTWWNGLNKKQKERNLKTFELLRKRVASATGYVFHHDIDNEIIKNVDRCSIFNKDYEKEISQDKKFNYTTRSMYPVPLKIKEVKIGTLVITDTRRNGFIPSDLEIIKIFSYFIAKIIYNRLENNFYNDIITFERLKKGIFTCPSEISKKINSLQT